ncbi:MAG: hypothetical protein A2622_12160 [Bdellovibrionales bacterium RIFCSPHIGHO2_01_FULL_40_29]|nr:MAG: hypothetical protein A2622_12160 [Bdellovibrionales bacterium RIFCSPHIGHO2_01_FULL_40_29]OFZ32943.1 MAG: hypothetical protein A3D17_09465 [Bdellovibrionales bacterium RIFCSPHIGHO2_02_FULL_40_15]
MKIKLNEIPEEGRSYEFNRKTAELNSILADIISDEPYDIQFFIKPLNSKDFTISGMIKANSPEICSRCGDSFKYSVQKKINEILIPKPEVDRTGKYAKSSVAVSEADDGVSVIEYENSQFDLGDFLHESIAIDIPFNPMPPVKMNGDCSLCDKPKNRDAVIYDENLSVEKKNPFAGLKDLKLKNIKLN